MAQKFDRIKMWELHKEGKNMTEIAKELGVSTVAICKAMDKVERKVAAISTLEVAHKIVRRELDVVDQLQKINLATRQILDDLVSKIKQKPTTTVDVKGQKDLRALALDASAEIRQQLTFQVEIFKTLSDFKIMSEFQKEVLDVIGAANKCANCGEELRCVRCGEKIDLRAAIINRLKAQKALRASVQVR